MVAREEKMDGWMDVGKKRGRRNGESGRGEEGKGQERIKVNGWDGNQLDSID